MLPLSVNCQDSTNIKKIDFLNVKIAKNPESNRAKYGDYILFKTEVYLCIVLNMELKRDKSMGVELFNQLS